MTTEHLAGSPADVGAAQRQLEQLWNAGAIITGEWAQRAMYSDFPWPGDLGPLPVLTPNGTPRPIGIVLPEHADDIANIERNGPHRIDPWADARLSVTRPSSKPGDSMVTGGYLLNGQNGQAGDDVETPLDAAVLDTRLRHINGVLVRTFRVGTEFILDRLRQGDATPRPQPLSPNAFHEFVKAVKIRLIDREEIPDTGLYQPFQSREPRIGLIPGDASDRTPDISPEDIINGGGAQRETIHITDNQVRTGLNLATEGVSSIKAQIAAAQGSCAESMAACWGAQYRLQEAIDHLNLTLHGVRDQDGTKEVTEIVVPGLRAAIEHLAQMRAALRQGSESVQEYHDFM
jgi:hypothetical protein